MFSRFLLVGGGGFLVDAGLTWMLTSIGVAPWLARVPAILLAMTFTWLANRHFTYQVQSNRTVNEAVRYFLTAAVMASGNYALYLVLVNGGVPAPAGVALSTACQTVFSFFMYRAFVFRKIK